MEDRGREGSKNGAEETVKSNEGLGIRKKVGMLTHNASAYCSMLGRELGLFTTS